MTTDETAPGGPPSRRKLPKQLANEARMIDAAIALLEDHTVAEVTNVALAEASHTQPSYVTRYFGGRDQFLLAVAEELSSRIASHNLGLRVLLATPEEDTRFTTIFTIPEVESWFKLWRYLVGSDIPSVIEHAGHLALLEAGITNLREQFGFDPGEARTWALLTLISVLGYRLFGGVLGISPDEAAAVADKVIGALLREAPTRPAPGGRDGTPA